MKHVLIGGLAAFGLAGCLGALACALIAWAASNEEPLDLPSPNRAVEGVVKPGPVSPSPVGDPFLYGHVRVTYVKDNQSHRLWSGEVGSRWVRVRGADKTRSWQMPNPWDSFVRDAETTSVSTLKGLPIVEDVRGWRQTNAEEFVVTVVAIRAGDQVILRRGEARTAQRVWFGTRDELVARDEATRDEAVRRFGTLALGFGAVGTLMLLAGATSYVVGRRASRSTP